MFIPLLERIFSIWCHGQQVNIIQALVMGTSAVVALTTEGFFWL
jgi:hypothetical protein